jgi:hypothetical protein
MATIDELLSFPIIDSRVNDFDQNGWPSMALIQIEMIFLSHEIPDVEKLFDFLAVKNQKLIDLGVYSRYPRESSVSLYDKRFFFLLCSQILLRYRNNREGKFYHLQSWMAVLGSGVQTPQDYFSYFIENTKV